MSRFAHYCNEHWQLGLPAERLHKIGYQAFFVLPEVIATRSRFLDEQWQQELQIIDQAPSLIACQRVFPLAVPSVEKLAQYSSALWYCTVRKDQEEIKQATIAWLHTQQFPSPDRVVFCRSLMNKLVRISHIMHETKQPAILIDDMYDALLLQFHRLQEGLHTTLSPQRCKMIADLLRDQLTIVAFQAKAVPEQCYGLRVLPLSSWEYVDDLIASFDPSSASIRSNPLS